MSQTMLDEENRAKEMMLKPTEFAPFNLTQVKPKIIEEPIALKREIKANPVPSKIYRKTLKEIEQDKKDRRQSKIKMI